LVNYEVSFISLKFRLFWYCRHCRHLQEAQLMLTNPRHAFTPGMVSYQCSIETLSPTRIVFEIAFSNTVTLKSGSKVT